MLSTPTKEGKMMRRKLARQITNWTMRNSLLTKEGEADVVCYGIETILEFIEVVLICFLIGSLFGKGSETALALGGFCILRSQAGGVHCRERWQCRFCMGMIVTIAVFVPDILVLPLWVRSLLFVGMGMVLYQKAPANGEKAKIEDVSMQKKKKYIAVTILCAAYLISFWMTEKLAMTLLIALGFEVGLLGNGNEREKKK